MSDQALKMERASPVMDPALTDSLAGADAVPRAEENDPRASLRHVLAAAAEEGALDPAMTGAPMEWAPSHLQQNTGPSALRSDVEPDSEDNSHHASVITTTTRRNANGSVSSVFSGNRITCLKKEDGQPFWRKDIQFAFLGHVFGDESKVFTKASEGTSGHTFAEIYIDAMAKSSKCSQILKEKLLTDKASAIDMAMICLLVNVGRMNTTLNFFPEMRARVRTYHAIPCLQAQQGSNAYKQLQDGPRLKSILKGAMEDTQQPSTIDELLGAHKPRTNPVNLIFVLSQYAPRVSETHFFPPRDFFDLFMRTNLSSRSRANAFLWLMWWYLESDFSIDASQHNPFGAGVSGADNDPPIKVPSLEIITDEQAEQENFDTEEEIAYGEAKRQERESIVANDIPSASGSKKGQKNPVAEQQHNYRFRYSPYGSSASDSGGSRGRPSPSPSREMKTENRQPTGPQKRHRRYDGDRTWSASPQTATPKRGNRAPNKFEALLNEDSSSSSYVQGQPPSSASPAYYSRRSGAGRGGRARAPRDKRGEASPGSLLSSEQLAIDQQSAYPLEATTDEGARGAAQHARRSGPDLAPAPRNERNSVRERHRGFESPSHAASPEPVGRGTAHAPSSGGATRTRARPQLTVEQSRRERINHTLYHRMQELRQYKARERRRRGAMVDAWIKCKMLPNGYDSAEDEPSRWAGLDEITALRTSEASLERKDEPVDAGDAGGASKRLAKGLNRLAWVMDAVKVPRASRRARGLDRSVGPSAAAQQGQDSAAGSSRALAPAPSADLSTLSVKKRVTKRVGHRGKAGASADAASIAGDDAGPGSTGSMRKRKKPMSRRTGDGSIGEGGSKAASGKKRQRRHLADVERESMVTDEDGSVAVSDDETMEDVERPVIKPEGPRPSGLRDEWDVRATATTE